MPYERKKIQRIRPRLRHAPRIKPESPTKHASEHAKEGVWEVVVVGGVCGAEMTRTGEPFLWRRRPRSGSSGPEARRRCRRS